MNDSIPHLGRGAVLALVGLVACGGRASSSNAGTSSTEGDGNEWPYEGGAYDGAAWADADNGLWVADGGEAAASPSSTACDLPPHYTLTRTNGFVSPLVAASGIAFDGDELWLLSSAWTATSMSIETTLVRVNPASTAIDRDFLLDIPGQQVGGAWVGGLAWDGQALWTAIGSAHGGALFRIDPSSGQITRTLAVPASYTGQSVMFDGTDLWLAEGPNDAYRIDPTSGAVIEHIDLGGGGPLRGCAMWVADSDSPGAFDVFDLATGNQASTTSSSDGSRLSVGPAVFVGNQLVVVNDVVGVAYYDVTPQP